MDTHHRASARQTFVVKKHYSFLFILENDQSSYQKRPLFLDWDRIEHFEAAFSTFNSSVTVEIHCMEKNPGMFSSKTSISFRLKIETRENLE